MYKLLIAEDELLERKAIRIIIERNLKNIEIIGEAINGEEAIKIAELYSPNIILMDIKMPEINGLEASKKILETLPNTKVLILTAYDDFKFAQTAIKIGIYDYLLKPAKPSEIVSVINKTVSSFEVSYLEDSLNSVDSTTLISEAITYINKYFSRNINLESVSEYIHLNPQYFSRYFKNQVGINFIDYITKLRINKAKNLLISTDKSIKEISLEVGYTDATYFSKVFTKHEGISPHKYRLDNFKTNTKKF